MFAFYIYICLSPYIIDSPQSNATKIQFRSPNKNLIKIQSTLGSRPYVYIVYSVVSRTNPYYGIDH